MSNDSNGNVFKVEGPLYRFFEIYYGLVVTGLLWMLLCIPVFTAGAATTAAYYTTVKVVRMQHGKITEQFFNSFKENFQPATILNFIYCILLVLGGWNCYGMYQILQETAETHYVMMTALWGAFTVLVLFLSHWSYFFLSRFAASPFNIIKMGLWGMTRHFLTTLIMIGTFALIAVLIYIWNPGILFLPGLYFWVVSFPVEKVFHRYMPKQEHEAVYDENGDLIQNWYEATTTEDSKKREPKKQLHKYKSYHRK
ncbi:MAG: DUF624 domain-containing protein [Lachnospiraceae bacterium]